MTDYIINYSRMGLMEFSDEKLTQIVSALEEQPDHRQIFRRFSYLGRNPLFRDFRSDLVEATKLYVEEKICLELYIYRIKKVRQDAGRLGDPDNLLARNGILVLEWFRDNFDMFNGDALQEPLKCWMRHNDDAAYEIGSLLYRIDNQFETRQEPIFPTIFNSLLYLMTTIWDFQKPGAFPIYYNSVVAGLEGFGLYKPTRTHLAGDFYKYSNVIDSLVWSLREKKRFGVRYEDLYMVFGFR